MQGTVKYQVEHVIGRLIGATITGAAVVPGDVDFGLELRLRDGTRAVAWVQCDAEGNGPGWLALEIQPKQRAR